MNVPDPSSIERIFYNSARLLPNGDYYGFKVRSVGDKKNKPSAWKSIKCSLSYLNAVSALKFVHFSHNNNNNNDNNNNSSSSSSRGGGKESKVYVYKFNVNDIVLYENNSYLAIH